MLYRAILLGTCLLFSSIHAAAGRHPVTRSAKFAAVQEMKEVERFIRNNSSIMPMLRQLTGVWEKATQASNSVHERKKILQTIRKKITISGENHDLVRTLDYLAKAKQRKARKKSKVGEKQPETKKSGVQKARSNRAVVDIGCDAIKVLLEAGLPVPILDATPEELCELLGCLDEDLLGQVLAQILVSDVYNPEGTVCTVLDCLVYSNISEILTSMLATGLVSGSILCPILSCLLPIHVQAVRDFLAQNNDPSVLYCLTPYELAIIFPAYYGEVPAYYPALEEYVAPEEGPSIKPENQITGINLLIQLNQGVPPEEVGKQLAQEPDKTNPYLGQVLATLADPAKITIPIQPPTMMPPAPYESTPPMPYEEMPMPYRPPPMVPAYIVPATPQEIAIILAEQKKPPVEEGQILGEMIKQDIPPAQIALIIQEAPVPPTPQEVGQIFVGMLQPPAPGVPPPATPQDVALVLSALPGDNKQKGEALGEMLNQGVPPEDVAEIIITLPYTNNEDIGELLAGMLAAYTPPSNEQVAEVLDALDKTNPELAVVFTVMLEQETPPEQIGQILIAMPYKTNEDVGEVLAEMMIIKRYIPPKPEDIAAIITEFPPEDRCGIEIGMKDTGTERSDPVLFLIDLGRVNAGVFVRVQSGIDGPEDSIATISVLFNCVFAEEPQMTEYLTRQCVVCDDPNDPASQEGLNYHGMVLAGIPLEIICALINMSQNNKVRIISCFLVPPPPATTNFLRRVHQVDVCELLSCVTLSNQELGELFGCLVTTEDGSEVCALLNAECLDNKSEDDLVEILQAMNSSKEVVCTLLQCSCRAKTKEELCKLLDKVFPK